MKRFNLFTLFLFLLFFSVFQVSADFGELEEDSIRLYPKTLRSQTGQRGNLIVPSAMSNVEFLTVCRPERRFVLFQREEDPIELENILCPSLPWELPRDRLEVFLIEHTFYLTQNEGGRLLSQNDSWPTRRGECRFFRGRRFFRKKGVLPKSVTITLPNGPD
jgi:hypothetical protein